MRRARRPTLSSTKVRSFLLLLALFSTTTLAAPLVPPNIRQEDHEIQEEKKDIKKKSLQHQDPPETITEQLEGGTRCRWGEHCPDAPPHADNTSQTTETPLPFVPNTNNNKAPPEGFVISSRVYTDPVDKLAHFDNTSRITLPYWECGVVGSTTSPLDVKHAYFRHALPRAAPHLWTGTEFGNHPQLLVALEPLELELNSGQVQSFQAGQVVLLEDVLAAGHKIRSSSEKTNLSALLLTLPQHYHHVGKDRSSLGLEKNKHAAWWCRTDHDLQLIRARKVMFAAMGLGLSSMAAVFLGKVAPLWLSVGIGGICLITGGTYATVQGCEYLVEEVEQALERRRLSPEQQDEEEEPDL